MFQLPLARLSTVAAKLTNNSAFGFPLCFQRSRGLSVLLFVNCFHSSHRCLLLIASSSADDQLGKLRQFSLIHLSNYHFSTRLLICFPQQLEQAEAIRSDSKQF